MFDDDEYLSFSEAARRIPKRTHVSTITRWASRGVRHQKLETVLIGGRRYVPAKALEEFLAALNAPATASPDAQVEDESRRFRIDKASRELRDDGFFAHELKGKQERPPQKKSRRDKPQPGAK